MHWSEQIARELIIRYPEKETFVCASGISPSGSVHIGNFREVVTTYFVVKSLRKLGKNARFIFSWDDYDRFRKVPKNIDKSFEKYIGMAYSDIPDPFGCHNSYAEHFEREFEESLEQFGINPEFIYQSTEYKTGRYNEYILHGLNKRGEIYDILMEFKTQEPNKEDRHNFYPITLYCEGCRKDNTRIVAFNEMEGEVEYLCSCGHHGKVNVLEASNIKLNWKIDWPMRWMVEDVVFEPGGRDHSSETGSYNVSKKIIDRIFNGTPPEYAAYEFIGIKGDNGKMSSSLGNIITPGELLKIYTPQIILFMFSRYKPNAAFNIGLDEDVIRNYTEYERFKLLYLKNSLKDEDIGYSLGLCDLDDGDDNLPTFNQVSGIFPLINFDVKTLKDVLSKSGEEHKLDNIRIISDRAEYWIKNWCSDKMIYLNNERNYSYYEGLREQEKNWLRDLCKIIKEGTDLNNSELMKKIYDVCHHDDKKIKKNNQRILFGIVYRLVLNNDSGPRIPLLIKALGNEKVISLLDFNS